MGFMLVEDVWRASGLYGVEETQVVERKVLEEE